MVPPCSNTKLGSMTISLCLLLQVAIVCYCGKELWWVFLVHSFNVFTSIKSPMDAHIRFVPCRTCEPSWFWKFYLVKKKTASPAPLRQQLLQLRLYALPIAAFTGFNRMEKTVAQLMTTKNACDALQCWTLDLCEQEFRHRNGNHAESSSRHGAAIYKWTPSHTSWNQMPFELRKSESHYEIQAYHLLRKLPEHHQVSARKPSGIPRRICAGIFRNFAPHLHRPPGTS